MICFCKDYYSLIFKWYIKFYADAFSFVFEIETESFLRTDAFRAVSF